MSKQTIELLELGCLFFMSVYHVILYFQVKRNYYLFLGLICTVVLIRASLVYDGSQIFYQALPFITKKVGNKLEYLSAYSTLALLPMFIYDLFQIKFYKKFLPYFQILTIGLMLLVIVTPHWIYSYTLNAYHVAMVCAFVYVFLLLRWAVLKSKIGAKSILFGLSICFVFVLIEMVKNSGLFEINTNGPNLVNTGVVMYLFFQSLALSKIFAKSFTENQQLTKDLELKVEARTEQLSKSNLVKDRFIQIVSHDLRGPLGNLKVTVDLLQSGTIDENESKQLLAKINKRVDQSLGMLDDMLEWSKVGVSKDAVYHAIINMNDLIEKTISLGEENAYNKNISIRIVSKEQLSIDSDRNAVNVVLRNLLSNAIKFTPRDGSIAIILDKAEGQVRVKVIDSGIGIPEAMKNSLFEMDRKNSRSGTEQEQSNGVGLALCKDLMMKIQGRITVDNNPSGTGTVFTCWFGKNVIA